MGGVTRTSQTQGSSRATRPLTPQPGELLWVRAPNTLPTRCSTRAGTGAAPGTATPRGPTTGSLETQTLTTGSSDSLEVLLRPLWLRMLALPPTAAEQGEEKLVIDWASSALLLFKSHLCRYYSDNKLCEKI